jgi:hypothetical protein
MERGTSVNGSDRSVIFMTDGAVAFSQKPTYTAEFASVAALHLRGISLCRAKRKGTGTPTSAPERTITRLSVFTKGTDNPFPCPASLGVAAKDHEKQITFIVIL